MKERLAIHKQIVKENERKLKDWKEEQRNVQYADKSAG